MDYFKKQRFLIIAIIILVILNLVTIGSIWLKPRHEKRDFRKDRHRRENIFEKRLGLTGDQIEQFSQLREAHFDEMKPVMEQLKSANQELLGLMSSESTNDSLLNVRAEAIAQLHKQIEISRYQHFSELRALCTPEQRVKFDTLLNKMSARGYGHKKRKRRR